MISKNLNIVVVGGGTAGWLTALTMNKIIKNKTITLIESDSIGILGAGEGSTPNFPELIKILDIDYSDFMNKTKSTHKLGISFENWNGDGKKYMHPFTAEKGDFDWTIFNGKNIANEYLGYLFKNNIDIDDVVLSNKMAWENKTPSHMNMYGYHFDANIVAKYFREVAESRGIKRIEGIVTNFVKDSNDNISTIKFENNDTIENIDFLFDCSGFNRLVIGKEYNTNWKSYEDKLFVNTAMPFFLPQSKTEINPYTRAIAMKYGWMWMIPLQHRWGCGYIFDDKYINSEEAKKEVEEFFGYDIETNRTIKFNAGRFEKTWQGNCIAIGLSSGFTEPIEATSIFTAVNQLALVSEERINTFLSGNTKIREDYNLAFSMINDDVSDFLQFHYFTKRKDTPFWKDYFFKSYKTSKLKKKINLWKTQTPKLVDFMYESFGLANWLLVGIGLDYFKKDMFIESYRNSKIKERVKEHHSKNIKLVSTAVDSSINEIDALKNIK
jgi:tryptophan halogenase